MTIYGVSKEDARVIDQIVSRALESFTDFPLPHVKMHLEFDLTLTHANGCPLKLREFLTASDENFWNDVDGIAQHLDRRTGELRDYFVPRFARKQ
ncbi:MAG: hypothetical protein WC736_15720 [Gallionella sp.]|jgi:hypothetical protein